jgi:hypothetical protein
LPAARRRTFGFNVNRARVQSQVPDEAATARALGTRRRVSR